MDGKRVKLINNKKKNLPVSRIINQRNLCLKNLNLQMPFSHRF